MLNQKSCRFILKGFSQDKGFRQFAFEGIGDDKVKVDFTVRADLSLIRIYGITIQELPLLCRELLEHKISLEGARDLTFTEEAMSVRQADRKAVQLAAALKKKPPRRPVTEHTDNAWRMTPPLSIQPSET